MVPLGAGLLSVLCFAFSWRTFRRCTAITGEAAQLRAASVEQDTLEQTLAKREANVELNLAKRTVKALARAAFTGGLALFFLALARGQGHHQEALVAFAFGGVGGAACHALQRRIGSLADGWRSVANRSLRRQGVDPSERTG